MEEYCSCLLKRIFSINKGDLILMIGIFLCFNFKEVVFRLIFVFFILLYIKKFILINLLFWIFVIINLKFNLILLSLILKRVFLNFISGFLFIVVNIEDFFNVFVVLL